MLLVVCMNSELFDQIKCIPKFGFLCVLEILIFVCISIPLLSFPGIFSPTACSSEFLVAELCLICNVQLQVYNQDSLLPIFHTR